MPGEQNSQFGGGEFGTIVFGPTGYSISLQAVAGSSLSSFILKNGAGGVEFNTFEFGSSEFNGTGNALTHSISLQAVVGTILNASVIVNKGNAEFNAGGFDTFEFGGASGVTTHTITLSVVCSSVSQSIRVCSRILTALSSVAGINVRNIDRVENVVTLTIEATRRAITKSFSLTSATVSTAVAVKAILRLLSAIVSSSGTVVRDVLKSQQATVNTSSAYMRALLKQQGLSSAAITSVIREVALTRQGTSGASPQVLRNVFTTFTGTIGHSASIAFAKTFLIALQAAVSSAQTMQRALRKQLAVASTVAGTVKRALAWARGAVSGIAGDSSLVVQRSTNVNTPRCRVFLVRREQRLWIDNGRVGSMSQSVPFVMPDGLSKDETLDFQIDMTRELAGRVGGSTDAIVSASWTVPTGVTNVSVSNTPTRATIFLKAPTALVGTVFVIKAIITTEQRVYEREFSVEIVNK